MKRLPNLGYLENGPHEQIDTHLERELELSGLDNDGVLTISTMTEVPPKENHQNTEKTKIVCQFRKKVRKEQGQRKEPSIQNTKPSTSKSFSPPQTILQKNFRVVPMQQIDPNGSNRCIQQTIEMMGKIEET